MKTNFFLGAVLLFVLLISCSDDKAIQTWQKGNLHTHSLWSDGDDFPEMIIQWYKDHDYQFIALSDHNTIAESEYWYALKDRDKKNKTLEKYIDRFGDWVETKTDSTHQFVRLKTFDEFKSKLEVSDSFLILKSEEVTSSFEKKPIHINVTNIQEKIEPIKGESVIEVMQKTLDAVHAQRERLNIPMFAHINHPNFGYGISTEDMKKLNGERFFELYNGHPAVNNEGNETYVDTETMWDLINIHYYQEGKPLLLGIATDDSHNYHQFSSEKSNTGRGWVMVNTKELEANSLITAMEKGDFYASTGVRLDNIYSDTQKLSIVIDPEKGVNYEIVFMGYQGEADKVVILKTVKGNAASYSFQKNDIFVRAKINSDAKKDSPAMTSETKKAWTQPFLVH
ncbi:MAG: histidinol-phosphatase [Flavobacteriaceae bacterium]|nr:histidinol-phosphatase [Flavobacteriaceae bacterium]